jgi:hypothetical protein
MVDEHLRNVHTTQFSSYEQRGSVGRVFTIDVKVTSQESLNMVKGIRFDGFKELFPPTRGA